MTEQKPSCRKIFEGSCLIGQQLQNEVYVHYPTGECEKCGVSSYSPGRVEDGELLTRLIVQPIHWDEGKIHPLAFQEATTLELSVFREERATDGEIQTAINEIKATGETKVIPEQRLVAVVMQALAGDVRESVFPDELDRMCFVYDTATPTKPSHASIFTPSKARKGSPQRAVRRALLELFSKRQIEIVDYRPLVF